MESVIGRELADIQRNVTAAAAILHVLGERCHRATIDLHSDYQRRMPPEVRQAEAGLFEIAAERSGGRRLPRTMGLKLNLDDPHERRLFEQYAVWSINTDVFDRHGAWVATFHDSGHSLTFDMDDDERQQLAQLIPGLPIMTLEQWEAADQAAPTKKGWLARLKRR